MTQYDVVLWSGSEACCTDMISVDVTAFSQLGRNTELTMPDSNGTTSHGDVEDMELSDTTQVTGDH